MTLRQEILKKVVDYAEEHLRVQPFLPGETMLQNSGKVLTPDDFVHLVDACLDGWLTSGRFTAQFERELAKRVGVRGSVFVNSGSSANLLAVSALTSHKLGNRALKPGDEVLTCAVGFPTTINPIIQNGLIPVFVDAELPTYNVNVESLSQAITPKTKAIVLAHALGNPFNVSRIRELCDEHGLWLVEDTCDALGSTFGGQSLGSFGDLATLSFYPAHHITTGEGGAVLYKRPLMKRLLESFRDWGRDCYCETGQDNTCKKRFEQQFGDLPFGYDHKFTYSHVGYNLKSTDLSAALGVSQLGKLNAFIEVRKRNFELLRRRLAASSAYILPGSYESADPAWFGFPLTLSSGDSSDRNDVLRFLERRKVGTRLLFAGNATRQPSYKGIDQRIFGDLATADVIAQRSFWVGVYPGLGPVEIDYIADSLLEAVNES